MWERKKTTISQVFLIFFHKIAKICFFWNFFILFNSIPLQFHFSSIHCLLATVVSCWFHLFNQSHACTLEVYNSWKFFPLIFQKTVTSQNIYKWYEFCMLPSFKFIIIFNLVMRSCGQVLSFVTRSGLLEILASEFVVVVLCVFSHKNFVLLEQLSQLTTSLLAIISKVITSLFVACYGMNMSVVCGLLWNEHNAFAN